MDEALINDNSNDLQYREVRIVGAVNCAKTIRDLEPFQQKVYLSCGHWLYNTYGAQYPIKNVDEAIRCRSCHRVSTGQK